MSYKTRTSINEAGEDAFLAHLRRGGEAAIFRSIVPGIDAPHEIDGKSMTEIDQRIFSAAVDHARGLPTDLPAAAGAAARKCSTRFFRVVAVAMEAVKATRWENPTAINAHAACAIMAKLEIEAHTGILPTQKQVKERAHVLVRRMFRNADFAPWEIEAKRWSKAFSRAGLSYLPHAVRSKSKR